MEDIHTCAIAKPMKLFGSKWTMDILYHLCSGKKRFGELQRELDGISPKTLSERLDVLEAEKIVTKTVYVEVPLRVEYSLTSRGEALKDIFRDLNTWSKDNL